MHPNPAFRGESVARNLEFARDRGFGVLAVAADGAPLISHVPFLVSGDGSEVELHLVRSNPIVQALKSPLPARIAVSGPDGYISPDWYGVADLVPTWNYVAVHLAGELELRPESELPGLLDRLSARFEKRLLPKPAWTRAKMTPGAFDRMLRMIVPCRMHVSDVQGTWKLGQNKPKAARLGAAEGVAAGTIGTELDTLAVLMRGA